MIAVVSTGFYWNEFYNLLFIKTVLPVIRFLFFEKYFYFFGYAGYGYKYAPTYLYTYIASNIYYYILY